jgi:hypothetical protein
MEKDIKNIKDQVGLIWLTMVGYIIYLEFFFTKRGYLK